MLRTRFIAVHPILSAVLFLAAMGGEKKVTSAVTAVTVFDDRAMITRSVTEILGAGEQTIVFPNLPADLMDRSLHVSGESKMGTRILDVKVETVYLDTIPEGKIRVLNTRLDECRQAIARATNDWGVVKSKIAFVDSLQANYARAMVSSGQKAPFDDWEKMLQFIEKHLLTLYARQSEIGRQMEELRARQSSIQREIKGTESFSSRSLKQITVLLRNENSGSVKMDIAYLVPNASWTPQYEARVRSDRKTIEFAYAATVSQSTGEEWKDVTLTLSTAHPSEESSLPELMPLIIDVGSGQSFGYQSARKKQAVQQNRPHIAAGMQGNRIFGVVKDGESGESLVGANITLLGTSIGASTDVNGAYLIKDVPAGIYTVRAQYVGYSQATVTQVEVKDAGSTIADFKLTATSISMEEVSVAATRPLISRSATNTVRIDGSGAKGDMHLRGVRVEDSPEQRFGFDQAEVQTQPTSSVFKIPAVSTIPSDNQPHKVGIMVEGLTAEFHHTGVPKLSATSFLSARAANTTEFPFLAGTLNVFFDESFVASSGIGTTFPRDTLVINVGPDEGVRLERKLVNKLTDYTGTFTRKTRVTYEYLVTARNLKTTDVDLNIRDQVPVSRNEKIQVVVMEPQPETMKPGSDGFLNWKWKLGPSEKRELKLKFSIEYPSDLPVPGI